LVAVGMEGVVRPDIVLAPLLTPLPEWLLESELEPDAEIRLGTE